MTDIQLLTHKPGATSSANRWKSGEWAPLSLLMVGVLMIVLDFFIVNVALPSVQSGLHASGSDVEWVVVAGYGLTFAVFIIASGRIGDRIGRRRTFALGLGLFDVTSAVCGLAPTHLRSIGGKDSGRR